MKVLVFGSANIDRSYAVDHAVKPGETIAAHSLTEHCGGKGFNQAVALSRAGMQVSFAGAIGPDGEMLADALTSDGIDASLLIRKQDPTGHAIIQVAPNGQNSIVIHAGANGAISSDDVATVLERFSAGDWIVLQNEISSLDCILEACARKGMRIALNPSPLDGRIKQLDLSCVEFLLVNETEGAELAGMADPEGIIAELHRRYAKTSIVLTLGKDGGVFLGSNGDHCTYSACEVRVVDTTAAGDTFTGFFLEEIMGGSPIERALDVARTASALSVTRHGASSSIPYRREVEELLKGDR